jgi:voltage-gated potassium channel Kch
MLSFIRGVGRALRNPEYRLLAIAVLAIVVGGTAFYHFYEGWTWIDSAYFTVVALTTVGFGDLSPSTELSRAVTIGFLFFGVTLLGAFISLVARDAQARRKAQSDTSSQEAAAEE